MAERLTPHAREKGGVGRSGLRLWAYVCLILGTAGLAVVQNGLMKLPTITDGNGLLAALNADSSMMVYASVALVLQAIGCCAAPLFAFLLAEGVEKTKHFGKYFLRVLAVAVACELPYNLAASGKWLDTASRNPAFGLVLALAMIWFMKQYGKKQLGHIAVRIFVAVAAVIWALMLGISEGAPLVVMTLVLWLLRKKKLVYMVFGCLAALACSLFSPFYLLSPMVFILLHFYNGEKGEENVALKYGAYPAVLLILGLIATYVL